MSLSRRRTRGGLVKGASCSGYYKGGSKARRSVSKGGKRKTRKGSGHCTTHNGGKRKTRKGSSYRYKNKKNNKKGGFVRSGSVQHFVTGNCSLNI